jgi:carbon monoxide dehydrogenase subunit G
MTRFVFIPLLLLTLTGARAATAQVPDGPPQRASVRAAEPGVSVREENGVYLVSAQFAIAAAPAAVLSVLSDYDHIAAFMPGVKRSEVRERQAGHAVVEQEAVSGLLMFSKRVHLVLDIQEEPESLAFHDVCGASFSTYTGSWQVLPSKEGSTVVYKLAAAPTFDVPGFMLTRLLKRDSSDMIASLQKEVASRRQTNRGLSTP